MGINTVPRPPYSPDRAPCDFCLFPKLKEKLRGCRYETIEKMKEAVTKVIDTLTQEDFHGAFQKLLERYNKCIAAGGDYFEGELSFMWVLSIKVPIRKKKSGNLLNDPRKLILFLVFLFIFLNFLICCIYAILINGEIFFDAFSWYILYLYDLSSVNPLVIVIHVLWSV